MSWITKGISQVRSRIGMMNRTTRIIAGVLALLVMCGGFWLLAAGQDEPAVTVLSASQGDLGPAQAVLQSHGISATITADQLQVPRSRLQEAAALLVSEDLGATDELIADPPASDSDIWRTQEQNDKRRQDAKMAKLGKLIARFPAVRSATVILEQGRARTLGTPAMAPTAAVKVTLKGRGRMSQRLVEAIADLVAGSVSGMSRDDVRIIDNAGMSYRASEKGTFASTDHVETLRLAEGYYREKIAAALGYIDHVAVGVNVASDKSGVRCRGVSVSVPRSYLQAVCRTSGTVSDEQLNHLSSAHLGKIRETVMKLIGTEGLCDVQVDWHHDAAAGTVAAATGWSAWPDNGTLVLAGLLAVAALLILMNYLWRRAKRLRQQEKVSEQSRQLEAGKAAVDAVGGDSALSLLEHMQTDSLIDFVRGEHPQTIAILLAHLSATKAAAVLGGLDTPVQVEVSRRVASLEKIDPQIVDQVASALTARLAQSPAAEREKLGGVSVVAQILHHAGYSTGQSVLRELGGDEPQLAELIRRRMFTFEDLGSMPGYRLRVALEGMDSGELAVALCAASDSVKHKVLASLGASISRRVREVMQGLGPLRILDVEAAQQSIVETVRRFEEGQYIAEKNLAHAVKHKELLA